MKFFLTEGQLVSSGALLVTMFSFLNLTPCSWYVWCDQIVSGLNLFIVLFHPFTTPYHVPVLFRSSNKLVILPSCSCFVPHCHVSVLFQSTNKLVILPSCSCFVPHSHVSVLFQSSNKLVILPSCSCFVLHCHISVLFQSSNRPCHFPVLFSCPLKRHMTT